MDIRGRPDPLRRIDGMSQGSEEDQPSFPIYISARLPNEDVESSPAFPGVAYEGNHIPIPQPSNGVSGDGADAVPATRPADHSVDFLESGPASRKQSGTPEPCPVSQDWGNAPNPDATAVRR